MNTKAELKLSTWIIGLTIFSLTIIVGVGWIQGINQEYPEANISDSWESSFNKLNTLNSTTDVIYDSITVGEEPKLTDLAEIIWDGTTAAVLNGLYTIVLIPAMIGAFFEAIGMPVALGYVITAIMVIIIIRLVFSVISAWLKRGL